MTLLAGERYRDRLGQALEPLADDVLWLPDNPAVDPRLAGHADLSVLPLADRSVVLAPSIYPLLVNQLTNKGYRVLQGAEQGELYPTDCGLCICRTGRYTIYNPNTADRVALEHLDGIPVPVTQGYAKCSTCVVTPEAIITADEGIAGKAFHIGIDVLRIQPGHIALDGFPYGFIGGVSFLLDRDTLVFTGTLDRHPDSRRIEDFLVSHGVAPYYLTNDPIFDMGGVLALP